MRYRNRSLLRLSGRMQDAEPERAPEQKSKDIEAAAIFRRFFNVLGRLDKAFRRDVVQRGVVEKRP